MAGMANTIGAAELKKMLGLEPHPREGGWFRETWKAEETIPLEALPAGRYSGARSAGTAIYYLLEPQNFSEMHKLASDEVFHFYLGDPVEMLQLWPDGTGKRVVLGQDIAEGQLVQTVVPQGVWQGTRLIEGGKVALLGCTVSPGFDYADYASGEREELVRRWPDWKAMIEGLTRS
jgi:predicted cupin superfamily sugar epimerase